MNCDKTCVSWSACQRDEHRTCNVNETQVKVKWTEEKIKDVVQEARVAGAKAAEIHLQKLVDAGPKYGVTSEDGTPAGTMLDVCGMAHLSISARGKFYTLAKKVSQDQDLRFSCSLDSYWGGGWLSIYDSTGRQELSVREAACLGQAEVLAKYGIKSSLRSHID